MIPPEIIASASLAAAAGVMSLVTWLLSRRQPPPALPPPILSKEELAAREEVRLREEQERERRARERAERHQAEQHAREVERRTREEEGARRRAELERRLMTVVNEVVGHVPITARRVQVGVRKTGERAVGVRTEESPFYADDIDLRPIRDMSELPNLLPEELAQPPELFLARIATGDALVTAHLEHVPVYEDVHEPVWEERRRLIYVLRDRSGSMSGQGDGGQGKWRIPVWRATLAALVRRARREESLFIMRDFTDGIFDAVRVTTDEEGEKLVRFLYAYLTEGGTNIALAIQTAIADLSKESYDVADIVIVTDGEDQAGLDPAKVRESLKAANTRLYAILLGANNDALRECADVYQILRDDLTLEPPVRRTP